MSARSIVLCRRPKISAVNADCLVAMEEMERRGELFDAVVTDPPYHLTTADRFGKSAIGDETATSKRSRDRTDAAARLARGFMGKTWDGGDVAFKAETWAQVTRLMRPGAYLVAFASTRGYHRMACAIEDAGFIVHPMIGWLFGTGFPKAHPVRDDAWRGWHYGLQALKPALEPICLAQKPMAGTGTENVLAHGCGAINVDACRVPGLKPKLADIDSDGRRNAILHTKSRTSTGETTDEGRWPANLVHDGSDEVLEAFAAFGEKNGGYWPGARGKGGISVDGHRGQTGLEVRRAEDRGTAARFFYSAKASKADRAGSSHPTVKPIALKRWLVRLVTPPGGVVLDPFAGTGTTLVAAREEGFDAVGIEREIEYFNDITRRFGR